MIFSSVIIAALYGKFYGATHYMEGNQQNWATKWGMPLGSVQYGKPRL